MKINPNKYKLKSNKWLFNLNKEDNRQSDYNNKNRKYNKHYKENSKQTEYNYNNPT